MPQAELVNLQETVELPLMAFNVINGFNAWRNVGARFGTHEDRLWMRTSDSYLVDAKRYGVEACVHLTSINAFLIVDRRCGRATVWQADAGGGTPWRWCEMAVLALLAGYGRVSALRAAMKIQGLA